MNWLDRLGLEHPVVQAGMGGGLATAELAAAVSLAGGLGTIGLLPAQALAQEIAKARALCGVRPFAVNLLMPFVRTSHIKVCLREKPAAVSLFFGYNAKMVAALKRQGIMVFHQVGNAAQAHRALSDGADALIVQGLEAGGHIMGEQTLAQGLRDMAWAVERCPVIAAGGIHDATTAGAAARLGAHGVAAGTRFLLTPESHAHPAYKDRLLAANATLVTRLFGLGWPAPHRVVANAATQRWSDADGAPPAWVSWVHRVAVTGSRWQPSWMEGVLLRRQRLSSAIFSPFSHLQGMPDAWADLTPLYAGDCVTTIHSLQPAAAVVQALSQGFYNWHTP